MKLWIALVLAVLVAGVIATGMLIWPPQSGGSPEIYKNDRNTLTPKKAIPSQSYRTPSPRFTMCRNPTSYPLSGLSVVSPDNIFGFTENAIIHFDGKGWKLLFQTTRVRLLSLAADKNYVAAATDSVTTGLTSIPNIAVFRVIKSAKGIRLSEPEHYVPHMNSQITSLRFIRDGEAAATSVSEFSLLKFKEKRGGNGIEISERVFPLNVYPDWSVVRAGEITRDGLIPIGMPRSVLFLSLKGDSLAASKVLRLKRECFTPTGEVENEVLTDLSFIDRKFGVVVSNRRLILLHLTSSQKYETSSFYRLKLEDGGELAPPQILAVRAFSDSLFFLLTDDSRIIKCSVEPSGSGFRIECTSAISVPFAALPGGSGSNLIAKIGSKELIVGSSLISIYQINGGVSSEHRSETSGRTGLFTASQLTVGTTYGVAIGNLDRSSDSYVYLVEMLGDNRLLRIPRGMRAGIQGFSDVSTDRGLTGRLGKVFSAEFSFDLGACIGDVNEDGNDDVLISYLGGPDELYINNGNGYFRDVTRESGLDVPIGRSECVTLSDVNNDGYLDIFATSATESNHLFLNEGNGKFKDVTDRSGLKTSGFSITAVFGDLNGDGYPDLYVGRWDKENKLYLNNGDGTFRDFTKESGTGCGVVHATNSVLLADFNNDGKLDIFVGNKGGGNKLFINEGDGIFKDVTSEAGLTDTLYTYGAVYGDFENNGLLDILVDGIGSVVYYKNTGIDSSGVPVFKKVGADSGIMAPDYYLSGYNTGAATFDAEGDGDLDAVVGQFQGRTLYLENQTNPKDPSDKNPHKPNFIEVGVEGEESNRDGIGAKVKLFKNGKQIAYREVMSSYGYASSSSRVQHFGVTDPDANYKVEVDFPVSGVKRTIDVKPGSYVRVSEYSSAAKFIYLSEKYVRRIFYSERLRSLLYEYIFVIAIVLAAVIGLGKIQRSRLSPPSRRDLLKAFLSGTAFFAVTAAVVVIRESLLMAAKAWVTWHSDFVIDVLIPITIPSLAAVTFALVSNRDRTVRTTLHSEIYSRLYSALRRFSHGEGAAVLLNRLALHASNIDSLMQVIPLNAGSAAGDAKSGWTTSLKMRLVSRIHKQMSKNVSANDLNKVGSDATLRGSEGAVRFHSAAREFSEQTKDELKSIVNLLDLCEESSGGGVTWVTLRNSVAAEKEILSRSIEEMDGLVSGRLRGNPESVSETVRKIIRSILSNIDKVMQLFESEYTTNVSSVVKSEIEKAMGADDGIKVEFQNSAPDSFAVAASDDLRRIIGVLLDNAIHSLSQISSEKECHLIVRLYNGVSELMLEVEDSGSGISEENMAGLFQRGFTTKRGRHGFGLSDARETLQKYGGKIFYDWSFKGGARFIIELRTSDETRVQDTRQTE